MKIINLKFDNQDYQINIRSQADKSVFHEIFELREYKNIEPIIKSAKATIIDVGAQAGFFVLYSRILNTEVQIYAIEPDENNLETLEDNMKLNNVNNVIIVPGALAGINGLRDFFISSDTHNHSLFNVLIPQIKKTRKINTYSLDDFLQKQGIEQVSLLKLDIEGAEYEVLNNFTQWDKINNIILEYHEFAKFKHNQLSKLLEDNNYKVITKKSKFDENLGFIIATK